MAFDGGTINITGINPSISSTGAPAVDVNNSNWFVPLIIAESFGSQTRGFVIQDTTIGGPATAKVTIVDSTGVGIFFSNNTGNFTVTDSTITNGGDNGITIVGNNQTVNVTVTNFVNVAGQPVDINDDGPSPSLSPVLNNVNVNTVDVFFDLGSPNSQALVEFYNTPNPLTIFDSTKAQSDSAGIVNFTHTFTSPLIPGTEIFVKVNSPNGTSEISQGVVVPQPGVQKFSFPQSQGQIGYFDNGGGVPFDVNFTGPSAVDVDFLSLQDVGGFDALDTVLVSLALSGGSSLGQITVSLDPSNPSNGQVIELNNGQQGTLEFPALADFDVFPIWDVGGTSLFPEASFLIETTLNGFPPAPGDSFETPVRGFFTLSSDLDLGGPTLFPAGAEISFDDVTGVVISEDDQDCVSRHVEQKDSSGLFIGGVGPFFDPDPTGCNFGEVGGTIVRLNDASGVPTDIFVTHISHTPVPRLDFGDAPDTYSTLLASNGARHPIVNGFNLGPSIDDELDGQPDPLAAGDDNNGSDDEDGVTFTTSLVAGATAAAGTVSIEASKNGMIDAWIDFDGDGAFQAGEQIYMSTAVIAGVNPMPAVAVPVTANVAFTFARFRFSSTGGLFPDGVAPDGEVEDYRVPIEGRDFGDAPDTFGTTLAANGARHLFFPGAPSLGAVPPDSEADGIPTVNAKGDDANNTDDEDGVTFLTDLIPGQMTNITVNAPGGGQLDAWVDFNRDGIFQNPAEQLFGGTVALAAGNNPLTFAVPTVAAGTSVGDTYSRFRISTAGGLMPVDEAPDGEVEDHQIPIVVLDFGDAPDDGATFFYETLNARDGARHVVDPNIHLGANLDADDDGQENATATGDDTDGSDDEDGVLSATNDENFQFIAGQTQQVTVDASVAGFLDAWVDFNGNGMFDDPAEQLFGGASEPLAVGANIIDVVAPVGAVGGQTFARFRFSTAGGLAPGGLADDGQVEDYAVTILEQVTNVQARQQGAKLRVEGDELDNNLLIEPGPTAGTIQVTGLGGTLVNNSATPQVFVGVDDFDIRMSGGNDRVTSDLIDIDGDLKVDMGDGDDVILIQDSQIGDDIEIDTGDDLVDVLNTLIGDDLKIDGDDGDNTITIDGGQVGDDVQIKTRDGDDIVDILDAQIGDDLKIDGGDGNNTTTIDPTVINGDVQAKGGDGNDELFLIEALIQGKVTMTGKDGDNTFDMFDTIVRRDVKVTTKAGNDKVVIDGDSQVDGKTTLSPGHGDNVVTIDDAVFGRAVTFKGGNNVDVLDIERNGSPTGITTTFMDKFTAKMGRGNDILNIGSTGIAGLSAVFDDKVKLDGKQGVDTLLADSLTGLGGPGNNILTDPANVRNFEVIV